MGVILWFIHQQTYLGPILWSLPKFQQLPLHLSDGVNDAGGVNGDTIWQSNLGTRGTLSDRWWMFFFPKNMVKMGFQPSPCKKKNVDANFVFNMVKNNSVKACPHPWCDLCKGYSLAIQPR